MPRPAQFTAEGILDGALAVVGRDGPDGVTVARIGREIGAPTGSIYHRFASRDELLVALWVRSVRRFQAGFLAACALPEVHQALEAAAVSLPRYCRAHPDEAQALTLFRWPTLAEHRSAAVRELVAGLNDDVEAASVDLCRRRFAAVTEELQTMLRVAIMGVGYGLIRPYIQQRTEIPDWVDDAIRAAQRSILEVADRRMDRDTDTEPRAR